MSAVEEFGSILKELATLKAPGVSGSRIKKLTDLAVKNVSEESQLITILYSNCKATPSSNKLGTLYVVDSIVRIYMDEARKQGQEISSQSPDGTFAAGVYKISELIESLVDDALELLISKSSNIKIGKLVDIWERADTFRPEILKSIRSKHFVSTTPPGTPPKSLAELNQPVSSNDNSKPLSPPSNSNGSNNDSGSILLALASLAKQSNSNSNTPQPAPAKPVEQDNAANNILSQLSALAGSNNVAQSNQLPPIQQQPPSASAPAPAQQPNEQYIFNMLQQMQNGGMPPQNQPGFNQQQQFPPQRQFGSNGFQNDKRGRDNTGGAYSRRNRSRSPPRFGQANNPNNMSLGGNANGRRPRSPPRQQQPLQQQQPQGFVPPTAMGGEMNIPGTPHYRPRNVGFDQSLPQGSFKVLSRTLFIGGVPRGMDEKELASVLRPYAEVQSVILNSERKHAFVKVYSRREAEQVITSFNKDNSLPLRTRWGVGFGPRDCCNYQHGISIIPISRLTDADRTWVVQAQWGGTGGQPLSSGMVIDEPDIEIGAGISSKAMSKKMPTNSARNGPKSNRPGEPDEEYVKTTLIPQQSTMSHGAQPDFAVFSQSSVNPLSGLFSNSNDSPAAAFNQFQQSAQSPPAGFPPNGAPGNPNLSAQLASFFQNGGQQ